MIDDCGRAPCRAWRTKMCFGPECPAYLAPEPRGAAPLLCPECGEPVEVLAYEPGDPEYDLMICPGCDAQGWRCTIAGEEPIDDSEFETDPDDRQYDDCDIEPRDYEIGGPL